MGAPTGNQFWKLRAKHGRDAIFQDSEVLKSSCYEYFEATDSRKWTKKDWVGKDATEVNRETEIPYTLSGLCVYLGTSRSWFNKFKEACDKDFLQVITHVEEIMYTQKFEGATVGAFNQSIIARDLGLTESTKTEHSGKIETITGMRIINGTDI